MKIARFFAVIFACIGVLLLIGSMGFFLLNRNAAVRVRELPQEAVAVSDSFAQALNAGDLEEAARYLYGQPDLGVENPPENVESALVWEAFRNSLVLELDGAWAVEQSALVKTGSIAALDVSAVISKLQVRTQTLLDQRIAAAESLEEIYDEQNNFREELVSQILEEALQQALSQNAELITREVTLKLVNRDGQWWVVPDQNLLKVLTGLA